MLELRRYTWPSSLEVPSNSTYEVKPVPPCEGAAGADCAVATTARTRVASRNLPGTANRLGIGCDLRLPTRGTLAEVLRKKSAVVCSISADFLCILYATYIGRK